MKLRLIYSLGAMMSLSVACQGQKQNPKESKSTQIIHKADTTKKFYGYSAQKFLKLPKEEVQKVIKKHKLTPYKLIMARMEAENLLLLMQIKKDSIATMQGYDRIKKKLSDN